jgi:hypothetical protein
MRRPSGLSVLSAIEELEGWDGNVPYCHLSWRFCARGRIKADDLHTILEELQAHGLIVRDGPTYHGVQYALTHRGRALVQPQEISRKAA